MEPALFDISLLDITTSLSLAAILGLLIGAERSMAGKHAGMRTFALVSLGSALFVTTGILVTGQYLGKVPFDPMRMASSIITGVGFIGAGLIIVRDNVLRGLTTAAGLWVSAGVGIAAGFGMYALATITTVLTIIIFTLVWVIENKVKSNFAHTPPTVLNPLTTTEEEIDE